MVKRTPLGFKHIEDEELLYWLKHRASLFNRSSTKK